MDEGRPSSTAEGAAIMRALHQKLDGEPKILDDPISPLLVDEQSEAYRARLDFLACIPEATRLRFRSIFPMRSRFAEDCLAEAFRAGVRQYVLLGAGLDTFAYRQPSWAIALQIFEVDHPATQHWKRERLTAAGVQIPDNVTFVPVDFEKVALPTALSHAGFDSGVATFFSMLAVSQYLNPVALDETWGFVLRMPARSEIVFSFTPQDAVLPPDELELVRVLVARFAAMGEPWLSRFLPEQLVGKLTAMGFSRVFHLTPAIANARYFRNRSDGLSAPFGEQLIRAIV